MTDYGPKILEKADIILNRVQSICAAIKAEGFDDAADIFEQRFCRSYDTLLPYIAKRDFENAEVRALVNMVRSDVESLEQLAALVQLNKKVKNAIGDLCG